MTEFKQIKITLDKERILRLTMRGINEFQQVTGVDLLTMDNLQDLTPREMTALIWVCLNDWTVKLEDIPKLIEPIDAIELMKAIIECITNSLPEVKQENVPLPEQPPIGLPSGVSQSITSKSIKTLSGD
jgi:hypothetical protein